VALFFRAPIFRILQRAREQDRVAYFKKAEEVMEAQWKKMQRLTTEIDAGTTLLTRRVLRESALESENKDELLQELNNVDRTIDQIGGYKKKFAQFEYRQLREEISTSYGGLRALRERLAELQKGLNKRFQIWGFFSTRAKRKAVIDEIAQVEKQIGAVSKHIEAITEAYKKKLEELNQKELQVIKHCERLSGKLNGVYGLLVRITMQENKGMANIDKEARKLTRAIG